MAKAKRKSPIAEKRIAARKAVVDQLGALEAEHEALMAPIAATLAKAAAKSKEAEALRKQVAAWAAEDGLTGAQTADYLGAQYQSFVGPAENKTTVLVGRLVEAIGADRVLAIASVTQKAVKELKGVSVPPDVFSTARTGSRTVTTAPIAARRPQAVA